MDTLENILDQWEKDAEINPTEPGKELIKIPKLQSKYLRILVTTKLRLKSVKNDFAEAKKTRLNYYKGNYNTDKAKLLELGKEPFKFILKEDMSFYLESDPDLIKITDKISYYEETIKALEAIMQELKNRVWELKSFIDWEKFIQGA
jgi:hypothetical protein